MSAMRSMPFSGPWPYVAAGMEIITAVIEVFQAAQVVGHSLTGKFPGLFGLGTVRLRYRERELRSGQMVFLHEFIQGFHIVDIELSHLASPRIARKNWNVSASYR